MLGMEAPGMLAQNRRNLCYVERRNNAAALQSITSLHDRDLKAICPYCDCDVPERCDSPSQCAAIGLD